MYNISHYNKLILLTEAARAITRQVRALDKSGDLNSVPCEATCALANLCEWIDGVIDERDAYMPWCSAHAADLLALRGAKESIPRGLPAREAGSASTELMGGAK